MKKVFFMLIATVCVAGISAQTMHVWSESEIAYEQSIEAFDSITFTNVNQQAQDSDLIVINNPSLYKTWEVIKTVDKRTRGVRITLSKDNTFSCYIGSKETENMSWHFQGTGTFLRQGNLILLCLTSGDGQSIPTCLVYNNGKLYGGFGDHGSYDLQ